MTDYNLCWYTPQGGSGAPGGIGPPGPPGPSVSNWTSNTLLMRQWQNYSLLYLSISKWFFLIRENWVMLGDLGWMGNLGKR